ncbi:hypothetical protein QVD17_01936 [Tagetes erecta]|uniref:Uncharacterized protein n=1 Tax=Tagetes erecta TaxID=13708 RepID=A0AAD8L5P7_TARER|nr:hypothetical protein QVD17_01936 [Tagetes erecta]
MNCPICSCLCDQSTASDLSLKGVSRNYLDLYAGNIDDGGYRNNCLCKELGLKHILKVKFLLQMATKNLEVSKRIGNHRGVVTQSVENGVVRMKILVRRGDLEQVLEKVRNKQTHVNLRPTGSKSLEQRLKDMKRMRIRQRKGDCRKYWRPALESIPEAGVLTL